MKERIISLLEVQRSLASLVEQFSDECPAMVVTRNQRPVLSIMPYETYQALLENVASLQTMLEIMVGKELGGAPRQKRVHRPCEQSISWEEFQKEVGWE